MNPTRDGIIATILVLLGCSLLYTRVLNKEQRSKLEKKAWFILLAPFLIVWLIVHLLGKAKSGFVAVILAGTFCLVEGYFSRNRLLPILKKILNKVSFGLYSPKGEQS